MFDNDKFCQFKNFLTNKNNETVFNSVNVVHNIEIIYEQKKKIILGNRWKKFKNIKSLNSIIMSLRWCFQTLTFSYSKNNSLIY